MENEYEYSHKSPHSYIAQIGSYINERLLVLKYIRPKMSIGELVLELSIPSMNSIYEDPDYLSTQDHIYGVELKINNEWPAHRYVLRHKNIFFDPWDLTMNQKLRGLAKNDYFSMSELQRGELNKVHYDKLFETLLPKAELRVFDEDIKADDTIAVERYTLVQIAGDLWQRR